MIAFKSLSLVKLIWIQVCFYEYVNGAHVSSLRNSEQFPGEMNEQEELSPQSLQKYGSSHYVKLGNNFSVECNENFKDVDGIEYAFCFLLKFKFPGYTRLEDCMKENFPDLDYQMIKENYPSDSMSARILFSYCTIYYPIFVSNLEINSAKYLDSGSYHCVYQNEDIDKAIFTTQTYTIFDSK